MTDHRLDHPVYVATVRRESERLVEVLRGTDLTAPVPACDGWTAADLVHHLTEVQDSWVHAVTTGTERPEEAAPPRAADDALLTAAAAAGTALVQALAERSPGDPSWSWHEDGGTVGWAARRQAHEALVHRVDAELAAGVEVTPPPVELAVDGVDELLRVMVDGVPSWGTFTPDGVAVRLECTNADAAWRLDLGRFTGTGPESGRAFDLDAAAVSDVERGAARSDGTVGADDADVADDAALVVRGRAWDLDRWLWGRGGVEALEVRGDAALLARLRELVTEATQ
ncbi:maleylpyruvate isomerase N-terminal domain-containing protein [Actinotalea solisilvae]|uniref:maleylpyruvate isomerase N-terminal domain-containing protein n=1 Tax=Actinotalea solisilvae TaxID=2072922 RepID=UPI0018F1796B|nr:maleylpyruvate isomerase N-terminal domain-containing protein [Actinotalea solisilvae]